MTVIACLDLTGPLLLGLGTAGEDLGGISVWALMLGESGSNADLVPCLPVCEKASPEVEYQSISLILRKYPILWDPTRMGSFYNDWPQGRCCE
ncbi:hypothetical protein BC939DRAFT_437454 [Gamsiella multidivaricata]|uniref:uncharacterized protein n=1 Tax=Gamsiella multidivaricata TaxID=101098 RepID=UPI00221E3A38|nr:uncharacterized protein BC939DRAFT_437454 [Gamsiella multidivaricata]KAI7831573.1 hypothetical protein BC939DRAFT_437454 [Gamsiella multidivaricata]